MMKSMMAHRNLRHRMNFIVLYGEVNQRKEMSGRLEVRSQRSARHPYHGCSLQVLLPIALALCSQPPVPCSNLSPLHLHSLLLQACATV